MPKWLLLALAAVFNFVVAAAGSAKGAGGAGR